MEVHTLQAGDSVLLDGRVRLTVLAVEGNTVLLQITEGASVQVVALEAPSLAPRRCGLAASPSEN
jgi:hypothetical protein